MAIHSFKGLLGACIEHQWKKAGFYLTLLEKFDEAPFKEKYASYLMTRFGLTHDALFPAPITTLEVPAATELVAAAA